MPKLYRHHYTFFIFIISVSTLNAQSLDQVVDGALATFNYGKDYCDRIDSIIELSKERDLREEQLELSGLKALCFDVLESRDSIDFYLHLTNNGKSRRSKGLSKLIESHIFIGKEENELAIQSLTKSLELFDPERDKELIIISTLVISWLHYGIFTYEPSIKYAEIGYQLSKEANNKYGMIEALDILANCYGRLDESVKSAKSDSLFSEYLILARTIDNPNVQYWAACAAGNSFEFNGMHDSAYYYFNKAYETSFQIKDSALQVEVLLYLGENAARRKNYQSSAIYLKKADLYPSKYRRSALDRRLYDYLSQANAANGNFKDAYTSMRIYKEIDDQHWSEETRAISLDFEAKYQSLQKDKEIATKELQISEQAIERNFLLLGAAALGLIAWFLVYRNRKNQKLATSKIGNLEKQQKLLALDYMVQGQEEERKRIAQDLHDGLGGLLSSARLQLQSVQKEIEKLSELNLLESAESMINNACNEVRRIAHDMMPAALLDLGLIEAIEDLADKIRSKELLKVTISDQTNGLILSDIQKVQIYRSLQEIMNNCVNHADASELNITFNLKKNQLMIQTSDNGSGFDFTESMSSKGLGLKNIESRIKYLNGSIKVSTRLKIGTTYQINIPI